MRVRVLQTMNPNLMVHFHLLWMFESNTVLDDAAPIPKRLRSGHAVNEKTPQNVTHPPICYSSLSINEIIKAHISADGEVYLKSDTLSEPSPILVADRWFADKEVNKIPAAGGSYLGSGYFKFGVRVRSYFSNVVISILISLTGYF